VFNRDFSNGYLKREISNDMFIDDPGSQSTNYVSRSENGQLDSYARKAEIKKDLENKINLLSIDKTPLSITVSGQNTSPLVIAIKTPDKIFEVHSEIKLVDSGTEVLTPKMIMKRLKVLDDTEYHIKDLDFRNLQEGLYLPFRELSSLKNRILFQLNGSREYVTPIKNPFLNKTKNNIVEPSFSVLISSKKDLDICDKISAEIYFQLPDGFNNAKPEMIDLFKERTELIPWFPSILIDEDYCAAVEFIKQIQPPRIVTNNTGIAYEAGEKEISWIAGPYMNITNSYSLLCLKEMPGCTGAFISNELNQQQIKAIRKPEGLDLFFSIYHPIVLMTSRQCLSHQVDGCKKSIIDEKCISDCERNSSIRNMSGEDFIIDKSPGNYHSVYSSKNYLNTRVISDFPDMFSGYFIDLRDIQTNTRISVDKTRMVDLFGGLINGNPDSAEELHQKITTTTSQQYSKGIL